MIRLARTKGWKTLCNWCLSTSAFSARRRVREGNPEKWKGLGPAGCIKDNMIYDIIYHMYEGLGLAGHPWREKNCLHNPWVSSFITSMIIEIRNVPNLNPPQHTTQLFWSIWILTTNLILWRKVWASVGLLEHEYGGLVENCNRYRSVPQSIVLFMC